MHKHLLVVKQLLDNEVIKKNSADELSQQAASDPLRVAKKHKSDVIALICSMFAYGNAKAIEKFLLSLDFNALDNENLIEQKLDNKYYRFQTSNDVKELFKTFIRLKKDIGIEDSFLEGYKKEESVMDGFSSLIKKIYSLNNYRSRGYEFLIGKPPCKNITSPYKRYNMFLRWVVRDDELDMGLWKSVKKSSLLIPLDVHTFNVSKKLGLLKRKSYDFKAVLELTNTLKMFDHEDPIKYDFALYRLGQSKEINNIIL